MTITIRLPDEFEAKLRARLENSDIALSDFVRSAIAEKLEREPPPEKPSAYELGKHLFGKYSSDRDDLAENADAIVREAVLAKHRR
jgi:Arc/MetJ-type ribon-helix-helix transcriptional regulator